ncbi:DUF4179 domain-containing protein [Ornithinibacillus halotolerans]|uniref:ECF-type sigma factor negative effector n=1 Tax=Ornithinibacillus halotolerans TaxID=1274357 RepID=A0A916WBH7_9BACI|nr:DUF4179 domain-containing protein [Ornithinibacillus halotolerans]GGA83238.1 ECF-type sigma factor negative effector [Ornithinibacillus halotolerans]
MKDIYELLNGIELELKDEDIAPVTEFEKKKLASGLKQKVVKKRKQNKWKRGLSVAILTFGLMTSAMIGLSFTAYAEEIPFLGNIFKFFNSDGTYAGYDENAKKLDLVEESNGIKISVMDTVFDGKQLFVTYRIETEKDLGPRPWLNSSPIFGDSGLVGSDEVSKIEDGNYIGVSSVDHMSSYEFDEAQVNWKIDSISTEPNNQGITFEGNWEFAFDVKAVESKNIAIEEKVEKSGIQFTAENIRITPMSFILTHTFISDYKIINNWDNRSVWAEVEDDLGNTYTPLSIRGSGQDHYGVKMYSTFEKLDPKATKLILTPIVELSDNDTIGYYESGKPIKANYRSENSKADYEKFQMEEIVIDLK